LGFIAGAGFVSNFEQLQVPVGCCSFWFSGRKGSFEAAVGRKGAWNADDILVR